MTSTLYRSNRGVHHWLLICIVLLGCNLSSCHPGGRQSRPDTAKASFVGIPVTGNVGATYYYHIADVKICGPYGWDKETIAIDWGEGPGEGVIAFPKYLGNVVGYHSYTHAGVFPINFTVTMVCDNAGVTWGDSVTGTSVAYVFDQPPAVATLACVPTTIPTGTRGTCTVTLAKNAPIGGSQVRLVSSPASFVSIPLTTIVPAGQNNAKFRPLGVNPGNVQIYASTGEGTATVAVQLTIK
jgi:hypothetical protein